MTSHPLRSHAGDTNTPLGQAASVSSVLLAVIQHAQVLLELYSLRKGGHLARERMVVVIEAVKFGLRLVILAHRRSALLLGGAYVAPISGPEADLDPHLARTAAEGMLGRDILGGDLGGGGGGGSSAVAAAGGCAPLPPELYVGRRSGRTLCVPASHRRPGLAAPASAPVSAPAWTLERPAIDLDDEGVGASLSSRRGSSEDEDEGASGGADAVAHLDGQGSRAAGSSESALVARINSAADWTVASEALYFARPLLQVVLKCVRFFVASPLTNFSWCRELSCAPPHGGLFPV